MAVQQAKINYFNKSFENSRNNMQKSWRIINSLLGSKRNTQVIDKLIVDGQTYKNPSHIAEKLNDYYSSVARTLQSQIPTSTWHRNRGPPRQLNSFYLFSTTPHKCMKIINKMKITKTNLDSMPVKIFKQLSSILCHPISSLINLSFKQGVFPESLKLACITPIFKKGVVTDCGNYRPIASLPYLSKIFERNMADKLINFLNKYSILSKFQFGFHKNRSACDALLSLVNFIYSALDERKFVVNVLIK